MEWDHGGNCDILGAGERQNHSVVASHGRRWVDFGSGIAGSSEHYCSPFELCEGVSNARSRWPMEVAGTMIVFRCFAFAHKM